MDPPTKPITFEEFMAMEVPLGEKWELVNGQIYKQEVLPLGRGGWPHECAKSRVIQELILWREQVGTGIVLFESMYVIAEGFTPIPDVSYLSVEPPATEGWLESAPDLAVEVAYSERVVDLDEKVRLYLAHGVRSVWILYPKTKTIFVFRPNGVASLSGDDSLREPEILPGFEASVRSFFED